MDRCTGKNCKFTPGFDLPHSAECEFKDEPAFVPDNSCGPNNIKVLNPDQEDVSSLGSAEYMKLLLLSMLVMDVEEIVIDMDAVAEADEIDAVICIDSREDGIHLSVVSMEEAQRIAKEQRGSIN